MKRAGVSVIGGHSVRDRELKFGYSVTGVVRVKRLLTNAGARRGDRVYLTKPLGTGILTTSLKQGGLEPKLLARVTRQMASLNRAAAESAIASGVHAATDVTGYGLIGHASQLADASRVTLRLKPRAAWVLPGVLSRIDAGVAPAGLHKNREFFGPRVAGHVAPEALELALYDPQTSGGLLASVPPGRADAFARTLTRKRVWWAELGEVVARRKHAIELA